MSYNFKKKTCDRCGVHQDNAPYINTGIDHPKYCRSNSFRLSTDGGVLCAECHKEEGLKKLFDLMDKREKKCQ